MQPCRSPANWTTPAGWRLPPTRYAARDLLLSLVPQIEREDRDDLMLEVLAQLGEIYLVRGANDGVRESIRRIRDCLAIYSGIAAGTMPEAAEQVRMSDAEMAHLVCRYSRRAQFLRDGPGRGPRRPRGRRVGAGGVERHWIRPRILPTSPTSTRYLRHLCADAVRERAVRRRPACAVTSVVGAGARRPRRPGSPEQRQPVRRPSSGSRGHRVRQVLRRDRAVGRGRTLAASRGSPGAGQRLGTGNGQNTIGAGGGMLVGGRPRRHRATGLGGLPRHRPLRPSARRRPLLAVHGPDPAGIRCTAGRRRVLGACRAALARTGKAAAPAPYSVATQLDSNLLEPFCRRGRD